jgi:hypothetical protein
MDNNSPNQHKIYRSDEIIERILKSLGLQRTDSSEYKTYTVDGKLLRVRVSDHGVNLSSWYRNNQGEEVPLNDSDNIAFTFLPNREECAERGEEFRTTAINKTTVYSDISTMTPIDFQFTVMYYIYQSWKFTEERLQALVSKIVEYTNSGKFEDPLHNTSAKATVFNDTSNNKPKKINCNRNMNKKLIRLTEQDLHRIVKESVNKVLNEELPKKDWGGVNIAYSGKVGKNEWNNGFQGYFVCTPNDGVKYCSTKREAIAIVKQFYQGEDRDYVISQLSSH